MAEGMAGAQALRQGRPCRCGKWPMVERAQGGEIGEPERSWLCREKRGKGAPGSRAPRTRPGPASCGSCPRMTLHLLLLPPVLPLDRGPGEVSGFRTSAVVRFQGKTSEGPQGFASVFLPIIPKGTVSLSAFGFTLQPCSFLGVSFQEEENLCTLCVYTAGGQSSWLSGLRAQNLQCWKRASQPNWQVYSCTYVLRVRACVHMCP